MIKIKSIKQLKAEKKRLNLERELLEYKLRDNWKEVKGSLKPVNIAKDAIGSIFKSKIAANSHDEGSIFKNTFTYGVSLLAGRFMEKAGNTLNKIFKN